MIWPRQCHFLTWCFVVQYSLWISIRNYVLKLARAVITSKITSVILDKQKSEDDLTEDFLSILKRLEITKLFYKNRAYISKVMKISSLFKLKSQMRFLQEFWTCQVRIYINSFKNTYYVNNKFQNERFSIKTLW